MSAAGWIFLVGMRVFDLGGMIVWLVWYFRQREDDDWPEWEDWDRDPPPDRPDPPDPGGSGLRLPLPDAEPWPGRIRDHGAPRPPRTDRRREPLPAPAREPHGAEQPTRPSERG
ncbi:hypothetical protein Q5424_10710 [Conexibacter sp. JD483]|uniref:hypothetical protein n=1 Tax=unclassified Conexibacter TaxID=2627773 RepID=UPI002716EFFC|nr:MULTISPECIES: hypothetical protein [unclassified Conexibacter]MDO8187515.1 hypothetical protein [Conexibacter sp. CPCC 205706]MDO8199242.1 hypothetical protein [Conexibacter sp. CPCC 205762]MDR9369553.1 hypothetical protein [Conexibacter sp. JD483]